MSKSIARTEQKRILQALKSPSIDLLKQLVEGGLPVDQRIARDRESSFKTLLCLVCDDGDLQKARFLIAAGASLNPTKATTPLIGAIWAGNSKLVKLLISSGADVNNAIRDRSVTNNGETALMAAVHRNNLSFVKLLLDNGADPNLSTREGESPGGLAVGYNCASILRLLIKRGCREFGESLLWPAYRGDVGMLRDLIRAGADVNTTGIRDRHFRGKTPLELAVEARAMLFAACQTFRDRDPANLRQQQLKRIRQFGQIIAGLIQAGANLSGSRGHASPLLHAAVSDDREVVSLLLAAGADPNTDFKGDPVLISTACRGHLEVVKILVAAGANLKALDSEGQTVIEAVRGTEKSSEIMSEEALGNPNHHRKLKAMYVAWRKRQVEMIQLLEELGKSKHMRAFKRKK